MAKFVDSVANPLANKKKSASSVDSYRSAFLWWAEVVRSGETWIDYVPRCFQSYPRFERAAGDAESLSRTSQQPL